MSTPTIIGLTVGAVIAAAAIWWGVMFLTSRTGWSTIAKAYPSSSEPAEPDIRLATVSLGILATYARAANIALLPAGLEISLPSVMSAGHRPILVPWSDIRVTQKRWGRFTVLQLGSFQVGFVGKDADRIREKAEEYRSG